MADQRIDLGGLTLQLTLGADLTAVRGALGELDAALGSAGIEPGPRGAVQLVAAEVLNNIVEHAYAGEPAGWIAVSARGTGPHLTLEFHDAGRGMPNGRLPEGRPAIIDVHVQDLPEGGFGWFMIHQIAEMLSYDRTGGENRLTMQLDLRKLG